MTWIIGTASLVSIARGTVAKVSGDRVIAGIDEILERGLSPAVTDRVYIRMQS